MDDGPLRTLVKSRTRVAARALGWLVSLAAIAFFVRLVVRQGLSLEQHSLSQLFGVVVGTGTAYAVMVILLALLWTGFAANGRGSFGVRYQLVAIYLTSQFAKYIPGNVFQFAARHALGRQLGLEHGALAFSAVAEATLLIGSAVFIVIGFGQNAVHMLFPNAPAIPPMAALLWLLICVLVWTCPLPRAMFWLPRYGLFRVVVALIGYAAFFALFGLLFSAILWWNTSIESDIQRVITHSSLAWLLGFIVPGAPAGAGMREASLALAVGAEGRSAQVLAAILIFRLATLMGDFIALCVGLLLRRTPGPL